MENNKTLSWDEIEQAHKNMMEDLKDIETSLVNKNIPDDERETLTNQLFKIYENVKQFQEQKELYIKDKI